MKKLQKLIHLKKTEGNILNNSSPIENNEYNKIALSNTEVKETINIQE